MVKVRKTRSDTPVGVAPCEESKSLRLFNIALDPLKALLPYALIIA